MGLIFTSYTQKKNANLIYLFEPVWCLVINFNLGAVLTINTNQRCFKLVSFSPEKNFWSQAPYWGVRKPWSWYLMCHSQAGSPCTSSCPSLILRVEPNKLHGYFFINHPMNPWSKTDIWLELPRMFTNALPSWILHVEIRGSINLIRLFKWRPSKKMLYDSIPLLTFEESCFLLHSNLIVWYRFFTLFPSRIFFFQLLIYHL